MHATSPNAFPHRSVCQERADADGLAGLAADGLTGLAGLAGLAADAASPGRGPGSDSPARVGAKSRVDTVRDPIVRSPASMFRPRSIARGDHLDGFATPANPSRWRTRPDERGNRYEHGPHVTGPTRSPAQRDRLAPFRDLDPQRTTESNRQRSSWSACASARATSPQGMLATAKTRRAAVAVRRVGELAGVAVIRIPGIAIRRVPLEVGEATRPGNRYTVDSARTSSSLSRERPPRRRRACPVHPSSPGHRCCSVGRTNSSLIEARRGRVTT